MEISENNNSPVDFERLREVSDGDPELINELVELYFSETRRQLEQLSKAVAAKDFDSIYRAAHKICGGSLTCGMNAIAAPVSELEERGRNQNSESIEQLLARAEQEFERMKEYLENNKEELYG